MRLDLLMEHCQLHEAQLILVFDLPLQQFIYLFYHLVEAQHDRTDLVVFHYLCPRRHVARTHTADHLVQFIQRAQQTADHAVCRQRRQSQY